jgi:hypothetical protein
MGKKQCVQPGQVKTLSYILSGGDNNLCRMQMLVNTLALGGFH